MTSRQQLMYENMCLNLRLEKFEKELNILNEKHLNDQKLVHQISNQINVLLKDKKSLMKLTMSKISELNAVKSKLAKVERKYLHFVFKNSNSCVHL